MSGGPIRVKELAAELGRSFDGDGDFLISGVGALESAGPAELSFVRSPSFARHLARSAAGALIAPPGIDAGHRPVIRSPEPSLDFARATRRIVAGRAVAPGAHPSAQIAADAELHASASVGPNCVVGSRARVGARSVLHAGVTLYEGVVVGADCLLHAGCVLREATVLGDRVILQPGVALGGDGFGYVAADGGGLEKVPQVGRVVVEDDVEIGANTTVDRGTLGETRIGRGAKIDNLVQIGHNCTIGPEVIVISQAGLSGSSRVEAGAVVMAQAGLNGHLTVGERAVVGPQCGVHKDVAPRTRVLGSPQRDARVFQRMMSALPRLPDLLRRLRAVERRLGIGPGAPRETAAPRDP